MRKAIYTTKAIEAGHRQLCKLTKTKGAFPNENSLLKLLYADLLNASEKWTILIQNSLSNWQFILKDAWIRWLKFNNRELTQSSERPH